jgi:hypothetical protein
MMMLRSVVFPAFGKPVMKKFCGMTYPIHASIKNLTKRSQRCITDVFPSAAL